MIDIEKFFKSIKKYKLKEENGHLLLPEDSIYLDRKYKIVKDLYSSLGDARVDGNFRLLKGVSCKNKLCVSPQCYTFRLYLTSKTSNLSQDDVVEIANDMDLNRLYAIGEKAYFEEYNSILPDILKLTIEDYKIVIAYLKGKQ